jgi:type I restriction enzyme M protein
MPLKVKKQSLESSLWEAADKLRSKVEPAEYKHVVLGLVFLKYVSDVFDRRRRELEVLVDDESSDYFMPTAAAKQSILESRDEYTSEGVFWVPEGARWSDLRNAAKQDDVPIGKRIDDAMDAIEKENLSLKGVLPKTYARRELTSAQLGGLIDTFSRDDLATAENESLDVLGRVYEYFLGKFASGGDAGEYYTPTSVVAVLVEMLEPFHGRVYDPACGSGGMFVQADKFVRAHGGQRNDISVFGQEQSPTTWRLAKMNLALRGIDANLGAEWGDSFHDDKHPDLRAEYVIANPPFNVSDWDGHLLRQDPRWIHGAPPIANANFAWIQHMLHHVSPTGTVATVLANGSLSSQQNGEGEIRKTLVEKDLVECIVVLPGQLFYRTQIPVCLWFLTKDKAERTGGVGRQRRDRKGEVLFIGAREVGEMATRTTKAFSDDDIARIADTYHAWRGEPDLKPYEDVVGFCASVDLAAIAEQQHVLSPGRYVGNEAAEQDEEPLEAKLARLAGAVGAGFRQREKLQSNVLEALQSLRPGDE